MKKTSFLAFVILFVVAISLVATIAPLATFVGAICSLPFALLACYLTTPERLKNKERKIIKKTN
jgi:ABC-type phosphate/phosphonate transport system permease subunit